MPTRVSLNRLEKDLIFVRCGEALATSFPNCGRVRSYSSFLAIHKDKTHQKSSYTVAHTMLLVTAAQLTSFELDTA